MIDALRDARAAERAQARFYRALASAAEAAGRAELAERFHDLHADEQHHFSRLTARLVELGALAGDAHDAPPAPASLEGWEDEARDRERAEVRRYEELLRLDPDGHTRALLAEILEVERHHADVLGGKWTPA